MGIYDCANIADILSSNTYPGRGIIVGKSADGTKAVCAYFIMGRSENSRNRIFEVKRDEVKILPYDASKVADPTLIIYYPLRKFGDNLIVTNGDQTDTIYEALKQGNTFEQALETRCFEPDAPNFTPRISAMLTQSGNDFTYKMSILKSADAAGSACNRYTFNYTPVNGVGHFIHTYNCDGNPIPTFTGEPERIAIPDDINEFGSMVWDSLNEANKISLFVRYYDLNDNSCCEILFNKHLMEEQI